MRMNKLVLAVVMLVVCGTTSHAANLCVEAVKNKEYDRAIEECTKSLNQGNTSKNMATIYNIRGNVYATKGLYDKAIEDFDKAIELVPNYANAYANRGSIYAYNGLYDKAIADFGKVIELDPKYAIAYNERGIAYEDKGLYDKAIEDFGKAIELAPKYAFAYNNRGTAYDKKGLYDKAIADFGKAIELVPNYANAYANRGSIYAYKGLYDKAITDYDRVIELAPKYANAYANRGTAFMNKGLYDKAIADYSKVIELNPEGEYTYLYLLITTWLSKKEDAEAVEKLRQHVASNDSREWIRMISNYYLGIAGVNEQDVLAEARKGKDAKELREKLCKAYFYLGAKRLANGNRSGAAEYFTKGVETDERSFIEYSVSKAMLILMNEGRI
jgi:lipoprotein NlpI